MNRRRRHRSRHSVLALGLLITCALFAVCAGVTFAVIKNKQLELTRDIAKVEGRIGDLQLDIDTEAMRLSAILDRYALRESLEQVDSQLVALQSSAIEVIEIRPITTPDSFAQNDFR